MAGLFGNGMGQISNPVSRRGLLTDPMGVAGQMAAQVPQRQENRGSILPNVLGNIGDVISQYFGFQPSYAPAMQRQREMQMREAERQRENQDWFRREQWKMDNQGIDPTPLERNIGYLERKYGPEFARDYAMKPTFVQNWDGTRTQVNAGAGPQPGHEEDGYIFKGGDPADPSAWEPKGGGVSNGPGGFPH